MDITTYLSKKRNDREQKESQDSTEEICSERFLQKDCKDMLNLKLKFVGEEEHNIVIGRCFKHGGRGYIVYRGFDTNTGNLVAVIKWTLPLCDNNRWEVLRKSQLNYFKQIQAIKQEFKIIRMPNFNHLVHYLGMQHVLKKDKIIIYVLQEFVCGNNLQQIFQNIPVTIPWLQHNAKQILKALHCLHKNGIVHQNLRLSSIFMDDSGSIKLADYCLEKILHVISRIRSKVANINHCLSAIKKCSPKSDIYDFGVLILTLFIGPLKKESSIVIPNNINPVLKDFLNNCLLDDEQERWSADQLLMHPFLSDQTIELGVLKDNKLDNEAGQDYLENFLKSNVNNSRLTTEFNILKCLGKGGFGHVWKVQNKLDSRIYALKRIPLNPHNKQLNHKIKREVKLLSGLSHENIVRYYNSWIETVPDTQRFQNSTVLESEKCRIVSQKFCSQTYSSVCWDTRDEYFSSDEENCGDNNDSVIFLKENECDKMRLTLSDTSRNSTPNVQSITLNEASSIRIKHFMHIQMEFCENSTLKTAIDTSLYRDIPRLWRLFKEIVEGLHYIHQQGVIHRDLKPVNIFLDSNDHVKIGDFGLATDVISKSVPPETTFNEYENDSCLNASYMSQTGGVGTAFYVAPELTIPGKVHYNQKVDIYSLGIIFFEMCFPPPVTFMERSIILTDLRKKDIILSDKAYELLNDDMIHLIIWLLQHDISKRPTSAELIASKYISPLSMAESEYFILNTSIIAITSGLS